MPIVPTTAATPSHARAVIAALALTLASCQSSDTPTVDDPPDAGDDCAAWRAVHFDPCAVTPGPALDLTAPGTYVYDADLAELLDPGSAPVGHVSQPVEQPGIGQALLVAAERVVLGPDARLRVVSGRPLILASWSTMDIEGAVDVGSSQGDPGAGADPGHCQTMGASRGLADDGGGGGGGGGGFLGAGADGSDGDFDDQLPTEGGRGGVPVATPNGVRGGCKGGDGGDGNGGAGGPGGAGGGAIQLTARASLAIRGTIDARGAGGAGGGQVLVVGGAGGGGGGSGGYIGLDAEVVTLREAIVAANGGGGGEGSDLGGSGNPGRDGQLNDLPATGGSGGSDTGSRGGAGGNRETGNGQISAQLADGGGGGGGGGVGFIVVYAGRFDADIAIVSPEPISRPRP